MKKVILPVFALVAFLVMQNIASATIGFVTGTISIVRAHDALVNEDYIQITDVSSAGSCSTNNGLAVFYMKDDEKGRRMWNIAVQAKIAGKPVRVSYDDANLVFNTNGCYIRYIDLY